MNFLGHLYFSNDDTELMHANLFGDFVKGKDLSRFPETMQKGIKLHRNIDFYIDNHPTVRELIHLLRPDLPKIAGIAVDLYFDHLLAENWKSYHTASLNDFIEKFYSKPPQNIQFYSEEYLFMLEKMTEKNWLYQYQFKHGLYKACRGVSRRISFPNKLTDGVAVFDKYEKEINQTFTAFMIDAQKEFL